MIHLFTILIYQPFLNILVLFYWLHGMITGVTPDMGIAVIFLTILIRILLLPISLMEDKGQKERRELVEKNRELEEIYGADPIRLKQETKQLFRRNRGVVVGELFSLFVQVVISLMLWRMFETGLSGEDIHLIYPFMPKVDLPFNLVFLGKFDLTHTNFWINLLQSFMIFLVETVAILTSPYPPRKGEVVRMQLILPVLSFIVFLRFPAGKKLFVITTLSISFIILMYKYIRHRFEDHVAKRLEQERLKAEGQEQIVVETK
jgi:membrane protein insertase Oxa1/YidC/SpoIIIJ